MKAEGKTHLISACDCGAAGLQDRLRFRLLVAAHLPLSEKAACRAITTTPGIYRISSKDLENRSRFSDPRKSHTRIEEYDSDAELFELIERDAKRRKHVAIVLHLK
jgi:hypothetical protein